MSQPSFILPQYSKASESLPTYTSSLNYYGLALVKTEFNTPFHLNNGSRNWKPVFLHLNSTQLIMYNLNIDKKFLNLIIYLFFELNSLNDHMTDANIHFKKQVNTLEDDDDVLNDMFAGDAYGGGNGLFMNHTSNNSSLINESSFNKLKTKMQKQKFQKSLSNIKSYYTHLKDNQFLFEPTNDPQKFLNFQKNLGSIIQSFSLTNLQIGEAPNLLKLINAMYKEEDQFQDLTNQTSLIKYKNTLRLRIEYKQILLQFWSFDSMVNWYRTFTIGKDLSTPIELRNITKLKSIPTRNTSRNNALLNASANEILQQSQHNKMDYDDHSSLNSEDEDHNSLFSRRPSTTSSISSSSSPTSIPSFSSSSVTINKYKFHSNENHYSTIEKQYISNCIPDLNSFDKWIGRFLTISNVDYFIKDENTKDVLISYYTIQALVASFEKKMNNKSTSKNNTRTFLVHSTGLVGIKQN